jgi:hypothetical protein
MKFLIPLTRGLLITIDLLVDFTDKFRMTWILGTGRLVEVTVQERSFEVHLLTFP